MREASALQPEVLPLWPMWCSVRQQECLAIARHDGIIAYCHHGDCFGLDTKIPKNGPIFSPENINLILEKDVFTSCLERGTGK